MKFLFALFTIFIFAGSNSFATPLCEGGGGGSGGKPSTCVYQASGGSDQVSCTDTGSGNPECGGPAPCLPSGYTGSAQTVNYEHAVPQEDGSLQVNNQTVCPPSGGPNPN